MVTSIWGPPMWHYLHTMSFNYPVNPTQDDKKHFPEKLYDGCGGFEYSWDGGDYYSLLASRNVTIFYALI